MSHKAIILGAGGQLGRAFVRLFEAGNIEHVALFRRDADLSAFGEKDVPLDGASVVINCAAYTQVDQAESDEATATRVNGEAVGNLARRCKDAQVPLIHFSTDYVFDGQAETPYLVDEPRRPLNAYGRSKAVGEQLLEESGCNYLLVRTSWVYAPWGTNFVRTMASLMKSKDSLKVVHDQKGRPTHVSNLAERTWQLFLHGALGKFHITDGGECTWFEFASKILELTQESCSLSPCATSEFPRPAMRPSYSVLDLSKADALIGPSAAYDVWLSRALQEAPDFS